MEPVEEKAEAREEKTFAEVVAEYRASFMVTDLKVTSRRGYTSILVGTLLPWFGRMAVDEVDGDAAGELDLELVQRGLSVSTRNNVLCVLRSVLRFAVARGWLKERPEGLPRFRPVGQRILITMLLRMGVPVHVVQRMAGQRNLGTTERYVHCLREDLVWAGRRLG